MYTYLSFYVYIIPVVYSETWKQQVSITTIVPLVKKTIVFNYKNIIKHHFSINLDKNVI